MHIHVHCGWCLDWVVRLHLSWSSTAFDLVEWGMSVSMHVWESQDRLQPSVPFH